ncbi:hypothetical protein IQ13_2247 [Lacibacter cauensis]|uniref:Uncharacterized protein n=1 Tax=Lacibacter cauensis TaxID=510947 RepID=A0A562SIY6_9BACT|nr:hypothetical protein [Lacibacter cauensis]TWI81231.1 hypothetical protein IQ13_2247 [Lacibacter cauensis]
MQEKANVSLSAFERQLVSDPAWILTKNGIIEKVYALFGNLSETYKQTGLLQKLPAEITAAGAKISKGENYEGLPYVMLDYPRCFSKENVFAVRTFFWWGHFFSITLHMKGTYLQQYNASILAYEPILTANDVWVNNSDEEWHHHFRSNNMQLLNGNKTLLQNRQILKLAFVCSLVDWDFAEEILEQKFRLLLQSVLNS